MTLSRVIVAAAVVYFALGAGFALWPVETVRLLGSGFAPPADDAADPGLSTLVFMRLYGAMLLGLSVAVFTLRRVSSPEAQRTIVTALFALNFLACIVMSFQHGGAMSYPVGSVGHLPIVALFVMFASFAAAFGRLLRSQHEAVSPGAEPLADRTTLGELRETWLREVREAAAQEERSRLARDLHDSVKQQLFTINVNAAAAQARFERDPAGARAALADSRQAAHEAMAEMEAMLEHLQPAALAAVGLVEALRKQCEATRFRSAADVTVDIGELVDEAHLPPGTHTALFRIAQEALSNVARHARARNIRVRLGRCLAPGPWVLELIVEDDGNGFDTAAAPTGMGLSNIRARAREIGADVAVESARNSGTRVVVRVPLESRTTEEAARQLARAALLGPVCALWLAWPALTWPHIADPLFFPLMIFAQMRRSRDTKAAMNAITELEGLGGPFARETIGLRRDELMGSALVWAVATAVNPWYAILLNAEHVPNPAFAIVWGFGLTPVFAYHAVRTFRTVARLRDVLREQRAELSPDEFQQEAQQLWNRSLVPVILLGVASAALAVFLRLPLLFAMPAGLALWQVSMWRMMRTYDDNRKIAAHES